MKTIGLTDAIAECRHFPRLSETRRQQVRGERLDAVIDWARRRSRFYRELYRDLEPGFSLAELPAVTPTQLMARFDDWLADRSVHREDVERFLADPDNVGRRFASRRRPIGDREHAPSESLRRGFGGVGGYLVFTTGGSTGEPLVALWDASARHVSAALDLTRGFAHREDRWAFLRRGGRTMGVFATGGFGLAAGSVRARQLALPFGPHRIELADARQPLDRIVEQLNACRPALLSGYPSNLEALLEERIAGRLHIEPVLIVASGEHLSEDLTARLEAAFDCTVQTSYASAEVGTIACACPRRRLHVNDDWIIVEPVDDQGRAVADGVLADKILVTGLFNRVQPFIRYEIPDRVVMHHAPCGCGSRAPWLTLEGRQDEVLRLCAGGREVRIPPLALQDTIAAVPGVRRFQVIAPGGGPDLQLRLEAAPDSPRADTFARVSDAVRSLLEAHGVRDATLTLSPDPPRPDPRNGKLPRIVVTPRG